MRDARSGILAASAALLVACGSAKTEYERAAKALAPTFDAFTKLRAETLLDPNVAEAGDIGSTIKEQVARCVALPEKASALAADPTGYTDKPLVAMIGAIQRDLQDKTVATDCAAPAVEEDALLARFKRWNTCVQTCRSWFVIVEQDAESFVNNARAAGIDVKGIPRDERFVVATPVE
jgi:hypothetical protein